MRAAVFRIAVEEWRLLRRDRVAALGLALLLLLSAVACFTAWEQRSSAAAARARYQAQVDHEFESQPERHPHRMVHYGHFVFRPLSPLAALDAGVDAYTGHTLYLEGHRQNSANFGDVRQSSLLLRFGQLTPAFVLQVLAPLLLIFLGHGALARERESGTLRLLLAQGIRPWQLVAGKVLALSGVAALALLPAWLALLWMAAATSAPGILLLTLALGYGLWLLLWALGIVALSACLARARDALVALLAVWSLGVVLLPRWAPELASASLALPTRFETDIAVARELAALGDSHNPDDPYFAEFRKQVLARYGVARVEDLPFNYKGLVGMEGERLSSALFARYAHASFERQAAQLQQLDRFAWLSPVLALRRLSMAAAGTDLQSYRRFVEQAEAHRYQLVQSLNRLQAEKLKFASDRSSRDNRISATHWQGMADFQYEPAPPAEALQRAAPAAVVLLSWLAALMGALALATHHLGRRTR
ncbi:ABC transporter permease [Paucibacter aquatile]|uniref:ABC transporter permease n=1 Tax=Kinneretia aquatilis TaxID=2070761 RepID=A0A2N8KXT9_9BURK|nr:ABC transporter permease [Paucibacter aquatile]